MKVFITGNPDIFPLRVVLPPVGLKVKSPLNAPGTLRLPPISVPKAITTHLEATKPESPPEDPPQVLDVLYGFLAVP